MLVSGERWGTERAASDTCEAHQRESQRPCLLLSSLVMTADEGPEELISGKRVFILDYSLA